MSVYITGWAHTAFGRLSEESSESLIVTVVKNAIRDAGINAEDIDAIYLGTFNGGLTRQEFPSSLVLQASEAFRFKPVTRVENACATGSAAIYQGINYLRAGKGRNVLCVGMEKMTECSTDKVGDVLVSGSYVTEEASPGMTFPGIFGQISQQYFDSYGDQSDALAMIAVKNHSNGVNNPFAHLRKEVSFDFCRFPSEKNPYVAAPLKRTDCSLVSDGAAALVLSTNATDGPKAIKFRSTSHVNDFLPMSRRKIIDFEGPQKAWRDALQEASMQLTDLSLVETHDCFTIAELIEYEAMGLTAKGQGATAIQEGWTHRQGKLPINPSGGLKSKGHPIGATGVSMHVMAAMQLAGEAHGFQVENAEVAGVFNMGGAAVANYVSILERTK